MKFVPINTKVAVKPPETKKISVEDIEATYEGLLNAYMGLSDAQRNLDEVCQVMDNIEMSMKMLRSGSADAVKLLNVDKSLEDLLGIAEEKLTVQSAQEGFGEALKKAWVTFIEWLKKVCRFIASIFDKLAGDNKMTVAAAESAIRAAKDEAGKLMAAKTKKFIMAQKEAEFWKTATLEASAIIGKCESGIRALNDKLNATQKELDENTAMLEEALGWIKPEEDKIIELVNRMTTYSATQHGVSDEYAEQTLRDLGWNSNHITEHASKLKEFSLRTVTEIRKKSDEIDALTERVAEETNKKLGTIIKDRSAASIRNGLAKITKMRSDASRLMFSYRRRMTTTMRNIASAVEGPKLDNVDPEAYEV